MGRFKGVVTLLAIAMMMVGLTACDREVTRIESSDQPLGCADCHVDNNLITGKQTQWAESAHGTGESYGRGTRSSCAGCHSGNGFVDALNAGLSPGDVTEGDPDPTRQDCRTCHMIHESYTAEADWALRTEAPVTFYAMDGVTFDGGEGNLCVVCHQPRRVIPEAVDGVISGISSHWGPHHGPQSAMLLGVAGAGVDDMPGGHYGAVDNTCVDCHMGPNENHTFEPDVAYCERCHTEIEDFDYEGVQTEIEELGHELGELLLAAELINENSEDGHPDVSEAPEDQAIALWNWIYVMHEDKSMGVHNPEYAKALLEEGIARMTK